MESEKNRKAGRPREFACRERVQVSIERVVYEALRAEAARQGRSMSAVASSVITSALTPSPQRPRSRRGGRRAPG